MPLNGTKVGAVLAWLLLIAVVAFGIWTFVAVQRVSGAAAGSPEAAKYQALAAYVIVPVFQASLAALIAGGLAKALFTTTYNVLRDQTLPIKFYNW